MSTQEAYEVVGVGVGVGVQKVLVMAVVVGRSFKRIRRINSIYSNHTKHVDFGLIRSSSRFPAHVGGMVLQAKLTVT